VGADYSRGGEAIMKPAQFDYVRADTTEQALEVLRQVGGAGRILAGGQSLMAILNMRLAEPEVLIDISRTRELDQIRLAAEYLEIGAATTQASVEWRLSLRDEVPLLAAGLPHIAHFQIRNRGTVCGSIAHADPSAELPLILATLEGEVVLRSARRSRILKAVEFFAGMLTTTRSAEELVEVVRFPVKKPQARYGFAEFSARHGDFALVACAVMVTPDSIRLGIGGVADRPVVASWPRLEGDDLAGAINDLSWELDAQDDASVSASYRRHLVRGLAARVIEEAS
jgi:2-furoyl-CoA dehydrogenase FAD binding subunit